MLIDLNEKCSYCNLDLNEIIFIGRKTNEYFNFLEREKAIRSVPCITEDEYMIKNIIE